MLVPDLYVFTLKFLAYKHEKKILPHFFTLKKPPSKVAHNWPQTFFHVLASSAAGLGAQTIPGLIFLVINTFQDASVLLYVSLMLWQLHNNSIV